MPIWKSLIAYRLTSGPSNFLLHSSAESRNNATSETFEVTDVIIIVIVIIITKCDTAVERRCETAFMLTHTRTHVEWRGAVRAKHDTTVFVITAVALFAYFFFVFPISNVCIRSINCRRPFTAQRLRRLLESDPPVRWMPRRLPIKTSVTRSRRSSKKAAAKCRSVNAAICCPSGACLRGAHPAADHDDRG